jgi:uncharacterized protein (TIGR02246 family)
MLIHALLLRAQWLRAPLLRFPSHRVCPLVWIVFASFGGGVTYVRGQEAAASKSANNAATEKEIRSNAAAFVEAFNKRDATTLAKQWTVDGVYVNEEGQRFEGRPAIQSEYEAFFKKLPADLKLHLEVDSVRTLNSQTAIEEGRAALLPQAPLPQTPLPNTPGMGQVMSGYTVVHVKQGAEWLMAEVRENLIELPPDVGRLDDLEWLVGAWSATQSNTTVKVSFRWIENNHFLMRTNVVTEDGKPTVGGLEIIGVDRTSGRITSWMFNNDGSHAVGVWTPASGGWAIETVGVMADGTFSSATSRLSRAKEDKLTWKSVDRIAGDIQLPDTTEVELSRDQ